MSVCVYCHRRHMGNHAYQIWYKLCMLAEIKTPVKFICILSLGKAPNSTINNIIPCRLSVLCHWYMILTISGFKNLISSLTETQISSPTFLQKAIWYKWTKRKKGPHFLHNLSFEKWGLCIGMWVARKTTTSAPQTRHPLADSQEQSETPEPCTHLSSPLWLWKGQLLPALSSLSVTLPESGGPLGAFHLLIRQMNSHICHLLCLVPTLRWQQGTNRKFVPYLPPLSPPKKSVCPACSSGSRQVNASKASPWACTDIQTVEGSGRWRNKVCGCAVLLQPQEAEDWHIYHYFTCLLSQIFKAAPVAAPTVLGLSSVPFAQRTASKDQSSHQA